MKRLVLLGTLALIALGATSATATPILGLDIHHAHTNAVPGGSPAEHPESTVTQGGEATNEKQQVEIRATAGSFRLHFNGEETSDLPYDAGAAEVQAALRALPAIGSPNVTVTREVASGAYIHTIAFTGALALTDVPQVTVGDGSQHLGLGPELWFDVENYGDEATGGPITLTIQLPAGLRRDSVRDSDFSDVSAWSCPGSAGDAVVTCTSNDAIPRHHGSRGLTVVLDVDPGLVPGTVRNVRGSVTGGGSPQAPPAAHCTGEAAACATEPIHVESGEAPFGIIAESFLPDFLEPDEVTPVRSASSHPERLVVPIEFNTEAGYLQHVFYKDASETIRDLIVDLPPGFIGDPTAVDECATAALVFVKCPASSQVGLAYIKTYPFPATLGPSQALDTSTRPIFNMEHPTGAVADLAFPLLGNPVHIRSTLDPANRYAIRTEVLNINETIPTYVAKTVFWGVPARSTHDSERCQYPIGGTGTSPDQTEDECPTSLPEKPFLTVPAQCEDDNVFRLHHYDSWDHPGVFGPEIDYTLPGKFTECDRPRFDPEVEIEPTGKQANTPTGLDVHVKIAQNKSPNALATPPVKRFTVTLPEGMSFSPSFADGLQSCTLAQMKLGTNEPIQCPDASRIGEVELHTPLLPKSLEGSMYLAAQGDNPFGSTFALLLVLKDVEERGILVKIPGRIDVDPTTGQIVTVFEDTPQLPFDDLVLKFRSGPRAPLVSPPSCGTQTIGVEVASYAQPQDPVDASNIYEVTEGPNGTPCPLDPASRPFAPKFSGGTLNPIAGSYSTFLFRLSREDQEQELSQVTTVLPPGLVAKIAGIPFCPDAAIASISTELGAGAGESANPACPAASQIGTLSAGLGAGPGPNYFPGKVYLAGPYKGAPLSLAIVAPGLAGPFDLGNIVVRAALRVNPENAQVTAVSDPFPTILHGVILRVRDVRLRVDRPQTTLNPTNCSPMSVGGQISGVGGSLLSTADDSLFNAAVPFQVGECAGLSFKPKLSFRLFGGPRRGAHPKLRATLRMPPGGANIASASVALPRSEFLDQGHIRTICTRVQFAQDACPAGSIYGTAVARTPLLDEALEGPVYLRSSSNPLPDMVAALKGKIDVDVVGRIDSVNGGIRNTFEVVPDAPVSSFTLTLQGGKKGLLVNSTNLCRAAHRATAKFAAHNGDAVTLRPKLQSACKKKAKGKKKRSR